MAGGLSTLWRAVTTPGRPLPGPLVNEPASGGPAVGEAPLFLLNSSPWQRQRLYGRLAAIFFTGSGAAGLLTLELPAPGLDVAATAAVSVAAVMAGIAIWFAPWGDWPAWASLGIIPPAFALIALANAYGGSTVYGYGIFFVVAFVWIGIAHPPRTSLLAAPLATAAYVLPVLALPGNVAAGLSSAVLTIPVCVLVGEGIAGGKARLDRIESAWQRERGRGEQLRELHAMKDQFLSAVSHELRTPITICRGHLDVLDEDADGREVRAVKELLVDELDLMGRLVDDLTTLARGDDQVLLKIQPLPMGSFVSGIASAAAPILGDRLRVESEAGEETLQADPQRLTQALLNYLQNAADHGRGQAPVLLRIRAEPRHWRFEVTDEGGGLPPGEEEAVFEPFSTGSSPTGGTGLGLPIVRGIARAHGGQAGVVNRPGRGATFWIRIPR